MNGLVIQIPRSLAVAIIPVATVCLFVVTSIYAGNAGEFTVSLPEALAVIAPYALLLVAVFGIAPLIMSKNGRARFEVLLCALAVLFWLQGNILVWHYGVFDGSEIHWLEGAWRGVLDAAIWCLVLWLAISAWSRLRTTMLVAAVATLALQLLTTTMLLAANPEILASRSVSQNIEGREAAMRFSATRNIVHIVMDGFQSDIFQSILADKSERDFAAELRGFTFFENHLGAYPYTQLTVPAMLSGQLFYNDAPVESFISDSMQGNTIINAAHAAGYEVDIAAPVALRNVYTLGSYSNAYGISASGHVTQQDYAQFDAARLIDFALFRVMPHFAKALVYRDELWVFQSSASAGAYLHMQYFSDLAFLEELAERMTVSRDAPVYKLIHVMLSHRPFVGNARCEFDGRKTNSRENVSVHAQCGLLRVLAVLQKMKDLGIYDNSLIVLMADHGAWVPVENIEPSADVDALKIAMATPVFAVKPPAANHTFKVSPAPTSIIDVAATIADIAGLQSQFNGEPVFSIPADKPRPRTHLTYGYGINPRAPGYLFPMQEHTVIGSPYDTEAWQKGNRFEADGS